MDKAESKKKLKKYIEKIYKFLGDKYCFVSGAFVIEDADKKLLSLLKPSIDFNISKAFTHLYRYFNAPMPAILTDIVKTPMETHAIYLSAKQHMYETHMLKENAIRITCKCPSNTPVEKETEETEEIINTIVEDLPWIEEDYVLEDEEDYELEGGTNGIESRPVHNIKWYPFKQNNTNYIYLKLEDFPTLTRGHFKDAFKRYIKGKVPTCIKSRREDCEKDKFEPCRHKSPENPFESPSSFKIDEKEYLILETYERKGDEFFIPAELNDYLLENIDATLNFTYEDNRVTITKPARGGRRIRRTKNKKRTKRDKHTRRKKMKN
jgi:hypothetical protein